MLNKSACPYLFNVVLGSECPNILLKTNMSIPCIKKIK